MTEQDTNPRSKFKAACIQLNSQSDQLHNIEKAVNMVYEAAQQGAELIALPENTFLMPDNAKHAFDNSHEMEKHLAIYQMQKLAAELKIWLVFATLVRSAVPNKLANRSILVGPDGKIKNIYDKIHLFDAVVKGDQTYRESENITSGSKSVISELPWGKLGQTICYDLRFPALFRKLSKAGAIFITVPAAFTYKTGQAHWHVLLRARAIENSCYIIAPGQCGNHPRNRQTYGHSMIINPWGEVLAEASEDKEEIIIAEIDPSLVAEVRSTLPSLSHDRHFDF